MHKRCMLEKPLVKTNVTKPFPRISDSRSLSTTHREKWIFYKQKIPLDRRKKKKKWDIWDIETCSKNMITRLAGFLKKKSHHICTASSFLQIKMGLSVICMH